MWAGGGGWGVNGGGGELERQILVQQGNIEWPSAEKRSTIKKSQMDERKHLKQGEENCTKMKKGGGCHVVIFNQEDYLS